MRLAFDIDGTLTEPLPPWDWTKVTPAQYVELYKSLKPNQEVISAVNCLYYQDIHDIWIWTSRDVYFAEVTEQWLRRNDVHYNRIFYNKLFVDILLDDKSTSSLNELERMLKRV